MNAEIQSNALSRFPRYLRVLDVLETLCRRDKLACLYSGVGRILLFLSASILLRSFLDYWLHFAWSARAALLLADVVIVGWIGWRFLMRPLRARLDRERAALRLQAHAPELRSQVIATIQLVPQVDAGRASRSLVECLLERTVGALDSVDWKEAVNLKKPAKWLLAACAVLIIGLAWALLYPGTSSVLVGRYFLSTQAPLLKTQIEVVSGDLKVPRGSEVELLAALSGEVPGEVVFALIGADGATEAVTRRAKDGTVGQFELLVENAQESFSYRVSGGDARSRVYSVEVLDPPGLREVEFAVTPPDYTGLAAYTVPANAFRLVEGSSVSVSGNATMDLARAALVWHSENSHAEASGKLAVEGAGFSGAVDAPSVSAEAVVIQLAGRNGIQSVDNTRYAIDWVLDAAPEVTIETAPAENATIATGRPVAVSGRVDEDYGLENVNFHWIMDAPEAVEQVVEVEFMEDGVFDLRFTAGGSGTRGEAIGLPVAPGQSFYWWIEATDNRALLEGPQTGSSRKSRLQVVTPEQKIAELMGRVRESLSTIEKVGDAQREAGTRLQNLIEVNE